MRGSNRVYTHVFHRNKLTERCGFKKDIYYLYKAAWTDLPILHLLPYWDFNDGQLIDIVAFTNLPSVELFVNGKSMGEKNPEKFICTWKVPYEKGEIKVRGVDKNGITQSDARHSFGDSKKNRYRKRT